MDMICYTKAMKIVGKKLGYDEIKFSQASRDKVINSEKLSDFIPNVNGPTAGGDVAWGLWVIKFYAVLAFSIAVEKIDIVGPDIGISGF